MNAVSRTRPLSMFCGGCAPALRDTGFDVRVYATVPRLLLSGDKKVVRQGASCIYDCEAKSISPAEFTEATYPATAQRLPPGAQPSGVLHILDANVRLCFSTPQEGGAGEAGTRTLLLGGRIAADPNAPYPVWREIKRLPLAEEKTRLMEFGQVDSVELFDREGLWGWAKPENYLTLRTGVFYGQDPAAGASDPFSRFRQLLERERNSREYFDQILLNKMAISDVTVGCSEGSGLDMVSSLTFHVNWWGTKGSDFGNLYLHLLQPPQK